MENKLKAEAVKKALKWVKETYEIDIDDIVHELESFAGCHFVTLRERMLQEKWAFKFNDSLKMTPVSCINLEPLEECPFCNRKTVCTALSQAICQYCCFKNNILDSNNYLENWLNSKEMKDSTNSKD